TAGAAVQGSSDAEIQGALGGTGFRSRRRKVSSLPKTVHRGMAPQARSLDRLGGKYDPQTCVWRISPLFAKEKSQDRQAPQPRQLQIARGGGKARARGAV